MINVLFMIKNREDRFSAALYDLLVGREKKMKAFFEYIESLSEEEARLLISSENYNVIFLGIQKGLFSSSSKLEILEKLIDKDDHNNIMLYLKMSPISLNKELSQKLISRNNHEEIMFAIKNAYFSQGKLLYGFPEVLERGNHDEIMAFLNYPQGMQLCKFYAESLVKRGNHEEIMLAIKNACFSQGENIYAFSEVLKRGNHDEIMAFLNYPKGIFLCEKDSEDLLARNNEEEISLAKNSGSLFGLRKRLELQQVRQKDKEYDYISDCYGPLSCLDCPYNFPY